MAECVPFLQVKDIAKTIQWYENIGFKCVATNHIWEPECELNWARLEWEGAAFMLGPDEREVISPVRDSSLWFNVNAIDEIIKGLESKQIAIDVEPETFYGRSVVSFNDINGFRVSFSSEIRKT